MLLKEFVTFLEATPDTTYDSLNIHKCALAQFGAHRENRAVYAGAHKYSREGDVINFTIVIPYDVVFSDVIHASNTFGTLAADIRKRAGGRYDI